MPKTICTPNLPNRVSGRPERMSNTTLADAINIQRSRLRVLKNHQHNLRLVLKQAEEDMARDEAVIQSLHTERDGRRGME